MQPSRRGSVRGRPWRVRSARRLSSNVARWRAWALHATSPLERGPTPPAGPAPCNLRSRRDGGSRPSDDEAGPLFGSLPGMRVPPVGSTAASADAMGAEGRWTRNAGSIRAGPRPRKHGPTASLAVRPPVARRAPTHRSPPSTGEPGDASAGATRCPGQARAKARRRGLGRSRRPRSGPRVRLGETAPVAAASGSAPGRREGSPGGQGDVAPQARRASARPVDPASPPTRRPRPSHTAQSARGRTRITRASACSAS